VIKVVTWLGHLCHCCICG